MKGRAVTSGVLICLLLASVITSGQTGDPVRGSYANGEYGFSVTIPAGMTGYTPPQPAIDHGFIIEVSKADRVSALVHATTPPGRKTLDEVIADQIYHLGSERNGQVVWKKPTRLSLEIPIEDSNHPPKLGEVVKTRMSSIDAVRVLIEYTEPHQREKIAQDLVIGLFKQREDFTVVYFITLQTPQSSYQNYAHVVDDLQKGFKILKMYPDR